MISYFLMLIAVVGRFLCPEAVGLKTVERCNWETLSRDISYRAGLVELVPQGQNHDNWTEMLTFQFQNWSELGLTGEEVSLDVFLDCLKTSALSAYPEGVVSWKIIEKTSDGVIYEWILPKEHEGVIPEHDIARAFITPTAFHRIAITQRGSVMSDSEREKAISQLRGGGVLPTDKARRLFDQSIVGWVHEFEGGGFFKDWEPFQSQRSCNATQVDLYIPPMTDGSYIEGLEVTMRPDTGEELCELFEMEKKDVQKRLNRQMQFHTLASSDDEVTFYCSYPSQRSVMNQIIRMAFSNGRFYQLNMKREADEPISKGGMKYWEEKLKTIELAEL